MTLLRKEALEKACVYAECPIIPTEIVSRFPKWTHFQICAYHKRVKKQSTKGKLITSRRVLGFVFIFLARENGIVHAKPVRTIEIKRMTRRNFASYVRGLTTNMDNSLVRAFN
ncbi:MAG: hypothetical protein WC819_05445 [Parcubacteria group bacterium]|jgi:hypothetical protein